MASLVQSGKYSAMNTTDTSTVVYYVIKFVSEAYYLQEDITCDRQIIAEGKLVVSATYLRFIEFKKMGIWGIKLSKK